MIHPLVDAAVLLTHSNYYILIRSNSALLVRWNGLES